MRGERKPIETTMTPALRRELLTIVQEFGDILFKIRLRRIWQSWSSDDGDSVDQLYGILMKLRWLALSRSGNGALPAASAAIEQRERPAMSEAKATIYVVDDNPSIRRALSRLFRSMGYEVDAFPSALRFLEADLRAHPACVVLDVRMPRMSGLDLQQELSKTAPDLPIVFITGHGDIDMAVQAMKDGAVDFLPKPFDDQDLIDSVERALGYHRQRHEKRTRQESIEKRLDLLSPREYEVFERVVKGMLNKQIGFDLGTTEKTIKVHRARVMKKMGAESLADLVRMAERLGIQGPTPDVEF